ncbi:uncharacterized protein PV06_00758 [Exophiala oligosperma]|uniref:FAD/NAD(P)-binding domain-containing protein n=1 Tax=Exophiala oligosperma TaxID=215243 RepID=A0A0D2EJP7_9EURO|nr:uncharacterized protein PV06_00758 [Exophiala oligosperma]KIW48139.1 hypothetical protein PV06_00758 [Exophiala oligosperma]
MSPHATRPDHESDTSYDVIVVGGGAAGIGAAIGAKQAAPHARVLIIESEGCLGGAATHRGVTSYCGLYGVEHKPRRAFGAIWSEIHSKLNVDPEGLKRVLDDVMAAYGIETVLHCTVVGGERSDSNLSSINIQERKGRRKIFGKAFIDCSGDGDLAAHAGASTRYGNHGHINMGSLATRFGGLTQANPSSSLWRDAIIAAKEQNPALKKIVPRNVGVLIKLPGSGDICTYMASARCTLNILRKLPGHENMYLVSTGPNFGARESRHINSRYRLTRADIVKGNYFDDTVAVGACINTPNLFCAGRCVDGDQAASSAVCVMGTALATGQAAGIAAALRVATGADPDPGEVRRVLLENGALLDRHNLARAGVLEDDKGMNLSHDEV